MLKWVPGVFKTLDADATMKKLNHRTVRTEQ